MVTKKKKNKKVTAEQKEKRKLLSSAIIIPFIMSLIGLFFVYEASSILGLTEYGDSFFFLRSQSIRLLFGLILVLVFAFIPYQSLYYVAVFGMLGTIIMLIVVLIPAIGTQAGGARSWIDLGIINIQPTEIAKLTTIIYLASWFIQKEQKRFLPFLLLLGFLMFLIVLQPDIGTAIIIFSLSIAMYFLAGKDMIKLVLFVPFAAGAFFFLIKASPYRFNRLTAFFDPSSDPQGVTYHINQILISLGSGGLFGSGFGASRQKFLVLPEAHTDSIFAIIGEEFGFIGGSLFVTGYIILIYFLYRIYERVEDEYAKLLVGGVFIYFAIQAIVNLGGMVGLLPLTGVPLPFVSYGGSHLLTSFILIGIVINIIRTAKIKHS